MQRVVNIWSGSITTRNGALQLLLLVDYVFDWARDIYREDIIKELRTLATGNNDAATVLHTDTDIFSTHPVDTFDQSGEPSGEGDDFRAYMSIQESFSASDTPVVLFGMLRSSNRSSVASLSPGTTFRLCYSPCSRRSLRFSAGKLLAI